MNIQQATISKISPLVLGNVVRRERLFALLDSKLPTTAFWISGPGGSGKSTFVASYLEETKMPCLWYQIDAMDGDPATFFYYLGLAAARLMDPAASPMPLLTPEYLPNLETFVLRYFELLYQRIPPDSWLIFDNFQDVPEKSSLPQILASAIKQLSGTVAIAIVSRTDPPPTMARFIANRTMKPIGGNQLTFSPKEFATFVEFTGNRINKEESKRLYQITKGWIAGVILWLMHSENETTTNTFPADNALENIFDYFAAEILEKTAPPIRSFLLQTALLPHMTADIASQLTDMEAEDILENLNRKNFFIEKRRLPATSYQYHPLFREFLQITAARIYPPSSLQETCCRAAGILAGEGWEEDAIDIYRKAGAHEQMAAIILNLAPGLIAQGRYGTLSSWIESLPAKYTETTPWLLFWKGLAQMTTNPPSSQAFCTRAFKLFRKNHDRMGQVLSWSTNIELFFMLRGGFSDLDRWISEGEQLGALLPENDDNPVLSGRFASSMLMALLLRNQGHRDIKKWQSQCESLLDRCNDLQVTIGLMKNLFWSYHWFGQIDKALVTEVRLKVLQNTKNLPPMTKITISGILTLASVIAGNHQQCLTQAAKTLAMAEETGIHVYDFMMFAYSAYTILGTGELSQVSSVLAKMEGTLVPFAIWDHGHYHFLQAWYAMLCGNLVEAKSEMTQASILVEACGNPFTIALCQVLQSQLLLELGEKDQVEKLLTSVIKEPRLGSSRTIDFIAKLSLADCAYAHNRIEKAQLYMREAFSMAREHGLLMPFGLSNQRLGVLCAHALDAGIEVDIVIEVIRCWHLHPPDPETVSDRWPWPIRIYTLGQFLIFHNDQPLRSSSKTPRKPLELLTFLISVGQRGVFREILANRLWPDSDGDRAIQNLNTTLHRLRKLLGHDHAVVLRNGQLMLNNQLCWVDSWHLEWLAQQFDIANTSSIRRDCLSSALEMYRGPYTTGHEDIAVAVDYREQLEKRWFHILAAALPLFSESALVHLGLLPKALAVDDTAASVFPLMVSAFKKQGRSAEAWKILRRCRSLLAEQGILFGRKTTEVLKDLEAK